MNATRTHACALLLTLAVSGCASTPPAPQCPPMPAPPAWLMQGAAELAAEARQDYFALRDELALTRRMVLGLQDYVRTLQRLYPFPIFPVIQLPQGNAP